MNKTYQIIASEVYEPVFLNKLAAWGLPVTDETKPHYYKLAYLLKQTLIKQGFPTNPGSPSVDLVRRMQKYLDDNSMVKQAVAQLVK